MELFLKKVDFGARILKCRIGSLVLVWLSVTTISMGGSTFILVSGRSRVWEIVLSFWKIEGLWEGLLMLRLAPG